MAEKKAAPKAGASKDEAKKPSAGRGGLAAKVTPSAELAQVIGKDPITRGEVTKKIWDYIKANNLQDEKNRRNINADAKLKPIFGGKAQVTMFEMTKLVNQHLKS